MLNEIGLMLRGEVPQPPIARHLGFALTSAEMGKSIVELQVKMRHKNPMGMVQGGVLCSIADAAMGWAYATLLENGESYVTLELKINYLRPVRDGALRAMATVLRAGRTIGLVECDVLDHNDRLVAHATCTCLMRREH